MFKAINFALAADAAAAGSQDAAMQQMSSVTFLISLGLMVLVFYLCILRPQKKKEKEAKAMKDALQIGDEIVTIGGITGIVVRINKSAQNPEEDSIVIETGGDRNKVRVMMWAISKNLTQHDASEEAAVKAVKTKSVKKDKKSETDASGE